MTPTAATQDMEAECGDLLAFLQSLDASDWSRPTAFHRWTVADQIMHLCLVDDIGVASLDRPDEFPGLVADIRAGQAQGIELSQRMREQFGALAPADLLESWEGGWRRLGAALASADPELRMQWFGPPMGAASFATARQMEVWAHGQDIYDLFRVHRENGDRLHAICELGVRTQGWSFRNRQLERPSPPEILLTAPSGTRWHWNEGATERISGPAEDFALVVTQRRHVDDTSLVIDGVGARAWMEIAQCFAGAPETGPAPGVRRVVYR